MIIQNKSQKKYIYQEEIMEVSDMKKMMKMNKMIKTQTKIMKIITDMKYIQEDLNHQQRKMDLLDNNQVI